MNKIRKISKEHTAVLMVLYNELSKFDNNEVIQLYSPKQGTDIPHRIGWLRNKVYNVLEVEEYRDDHKSVLNALRGYFYKELQKELLSK